MLYIVAVMRQIPLNVGWIGFYSILLDSICESAPVTTPRCACVLRVFSPAWSSCAGAVGRAGRTVPPRRSSELAERPSPPPAAASPGPAAAAHSCTHRFEKDQSTKKNKKNNLFQLIDASIWAVHTRTCERKTHVQRLILTFLNWHNTIFFFLKDWFISFNVSFWSKRFKIQMLLLSPTVNNEGKQKILH